MCEVAHSETHITLNFLLFSPLWENVASPTEQTGADGEWVAKNRRSLCSVRLEAERQRMRRMESNLSCQHVCRPLKQ